MKFSSSGYLIKEGIKNIWNNRMMSLASIFVLVSCLIITGAATLVSLNVTSLISSIGDDNMINVYLNYELSEIDSIKLGSSISKIPNVQSCEFYSKDDAITDYKETLGNLYESMQGDGNPMPNVYKVQLKDLSKYSDTIKEIKSIDGVASVSDRSDIARKLTKLNSFVTIIGSWIVLILGIVTLFIISNTIRMTMYSRRFEISIMKSVGATNAFVRIPFMVEAMTIGLIAGLISSITVLSVVLFVVGVGLKGNDICPTWGGALWNGLFETLCVTSTSGFAILDNAQWPLWIVMVLMFSAVMCGSAGSTSGGVKVDRVMLFFKAIGRRVHAILHPSAIHEVRMGKRFLREEEVYPQVLFLAMYGLVLAVSVALSLFIGVDHQNSFIASVTSLGNVGPAYGALGTMGSFNSVPMLGKIVFTVDMFLGRIEIYPALALVAMIFDKRTRG